MGKVSRIPTIGDYTIFFNSLFFVLYSVFRDIAQAIGEELSESGEQRLKQDIRDAFGWQTSSQVADKMAQQSNRQSMLGDLVTYGRARGIADQEGVVHRVLGKKRDGEPQDGLAPHLGYDDSNRPLYTVPKAAQESGKGIANNGVLLPVRHVRDASAVDRLEGTLSVHRQGDLYFVKAPWEEIEPFFIDNLPRGNELFITNGRFNHLWNNLFHHLRNDYVNERYPEDLPGTIVEVNPIWAREQGIVNGQIVEIISGQQRFVAIASLQESVPQRGAFAMFSYPVREERDGELTFNFDGFTNNITDGYADGINPIGALKYARAVVRKKEPIEVYASPRLQHAAVKSRLGPTFEPRGHIKAGDSTPTPTDPEAAMLKLIEQKRDIAQVTHAFVIVEGETTLQDWFHAGEYTQILTFLRDGKFADRKLVVPGAPEESYFYELIHNGTRMAAAFASGDDREVVRRWIMSLRQEPILKLRCCS